MRREHAAGSWAKAQSLGVKRNWCKGNESGDVDLLSDGWTGAQPPVGHGTKADPLFLHLCPRVCRTCRGVA